MNQSASRILRHYLRERENGLWILAFKIENWTTFFQDWLNFHSSEWESTLKNLKSVLVETDVIF